MRLLILFFSIFAVLPVFADDGDETLNGYLSKADLVVVGKITADPMVVIHESGVPNHVCEFLVSDVLKGDAKLKGQVIKVTIRRFEMDEKDQHPLIRKDAECILFLNKAAPDVPSWVTADFWFGVQHPSPWMARSLKRLANQK